MDPTILIGALVGLVSGIIVAVITTILPKKGSLENQLIDQLQETIVRQDKQAETTEVLIKVLRGEVRILEDYASDLRKQISDGDPPPPKPWPTRG